MAIGGGKRTIGEHGQSCAEREQVGPGWHGMGGSGLAMGRLRGGMVRPVVRHHAGTGRSRAAGVMWRRSAILGSTCLWAGCDGRLLTPRVGSLFASSMRMFSVSMQRHARGLNAWLQLAYMPTLCVHGPTPENAKTVTTHSDSTHDLAACPATMYD